jgi:hypothetical protein
MEACKVNGLEIVTISSEKYELRDLTVYSRSWYSKKATLTYNGEYYELSGDLNPAYSSLAARLGKDYGLLLQTYAREVIIEEVHKQGGYLINEVVNQDGSRSLHLALNS